LQTILLCYNNSLKPHNLCVWCLTDICGLISKTELLKKFHNEAVNAYMLYNSLIRVSWSDNASDCFYTLNYPYGGIGRHVSLRN
jgi:hypothetical protein